jgi:hypothetical protein
MGRPPTARKEQTKMSAALHKMARASTSPDEDREVRAAVEDALRAREITLRQANRVLDTLYMRANVMRSPKMSSTNPTHDDE